MRSKKVDEIVDNPGMDDKALSGVSFNNDDRQFLKRNFDEMYEWLKESNTENQRFITEIIVAANNMLFNKLDTINENIAKISVDIALIQARIESIEQRIESFESEITSINRQITVHRKELDNTNDRVSDIMVEIESLKNEISCIKANLGIK